MDSSKTRTLLIDNGSTLLDKLRKILPGSVETISYHDLQRDTYDQYDLVILSGSSTFSVFDSIDNQKNQLYLIKNRTLPTFGICYGAQLIAQAYDGILELLDAKEIGMHGIRINNETFARVFENHQYGIIDVPLDTFKVLATNKNKRLIQVFSHKEKPLFGLQFHPEHHISESDGDEYFLSLLHPVLEKNT